MSLFDGKFIVNAPPSDFFTRSQVTLTRNRVDFSLGNSFKRVIPSGDQYFRFYNVQDKREIYLIVENSSNTDIANAYFPTGYWKDNVIVSQIQPAGRMLLRIVTQNGQIYYEALTDMALLTPPPVNTDSGFFNTINEIIAYGFDVETTNHNALFYINSSSSVRNIAVARGRQLAFEDTGVGNINNELTSYLSDTRIERIVIDEANELAYVIGSFDGRFRQSSLPGATGVSIVEVDLTNGAFSLFKGNAPISASDAIIVDRKLILINNSSGLIAYDLDTANQLWNIVNSGGNTRNLTTDGTHVFASCVTKLGTINVGSNLHFIGKVNATTGVIDSTFINNQAPFNASVNIETVIAHSGTLFFATSNGNTYAGQPYLGIVKLNPVTGLRDLSVATNTGFNASSCVPKFIAGPANTLYLSAVGFSASYSNAGSTVSGVSLFYKISTINGFADAGFNIGVGFSSPVNQRIFGRYKAPNLFLSSSSTLNSPTSFGTIAKVNPTTGAQDTSYQPVGTKYSLTHELIAYQDSIILFNGFGGTTIYESRGFVFPTINTYLVKFDLSTRSVASLGIVNLSSHAIRCLVVGNNAHSNKVFVGFESSAFPETAYGNILKVFNANTFVEDTGYPTFNGRISFKATISSIIQIGDLLYVSGQFENVQDSDGIYSGSPSFAVINIITKKVVRDSRYSLPFIPNATSIIPASRMSIYADKIYIMNNSIGLVNIIDIVSGEVIGDTKFPISISVAGIFIEQAIQAYDKGVVAVGSISRACFILSKEKLLFKNSAPTILTSTPILGIAGHAELENKISGISYHSTSGGQTVKFVVNTQNETISDGALPPVSGLGFLPAARQKRFVVPYVNYLSDIFFACYELVFNNKTRQGVARINSNVTDVDEAANALELPTSIVIQNSVQVKIKKDTNEPMILSRNTVKAEVRGLSIPNGLLVNPLTGNLQGRIETPVVQTVSTQYRIINALGQVDSNNTNIQIVDRAPWRNIAVGKGVSNAEIKSTVDVGNKMFVGGDFSHIGVVYNGISRISTAGVLNRTALAKCHDFNGTVNRVYVNGNDLFVFGTFTKYGEFNYPYFVKINLVTGEADHTFMNGLGSGFGGFSDMNFPVAYAQVLGNNVYIAGSFTTINGNPCGNVVALNKITGAIDNAFNSGVAVGGPITDINLEPVEGRLWLAGSFTQFAGNSNARSLAVLSPLTGALNHNFFTTLAFNGNSLRIINKDGFVYVVGSFTQYRGNARNYIVKLNGSNGNDDATFSKFGATNPLITSISSSDTTIGITATAGTYDGNPVTGFLSILANNGDYVATASASSTKSVHGLGSDQYVVGGDFTQINSSNSRKLAIINGLTGANITVYDNDKFLQQKPILDVKSYAGQLIIGNSDAWELESRSSFAAFEYSENNGLQLLNSYPNISGGGAIVNKILLSYDGLSLFIAGDFTSYNSNSSPRLVKITLSNGSIDSSFAVGSGFNNTVNDIDYLNMYGTSSLDNGIIAVGIFSTYKGSAADKIVTINGQGSLFQAGTNNLGTPRRIIHTYNGVHIVEGFTQINGNAVPTGIARTNGVSFGAIPAGLNNDPLNNKIEIDVFRNLYVYNNVTGEIRKYTPSDSYSAQSGLKTYSPAGPNSVFKNQGNFLTLAGTLGGNITYDSILYNSSIVSVKTLNLDKDTRIEVPDTQSGNGEVRDMVASGNTTLIVSSSNAGVVPFIKGLYGHIIRLNKSGETTPYNY
jgi:hypothetical protein